MEHTHTQERRDAGVRTVGAESVVECRIGWGCKVGVVGGRAGEGLSCDIVFGGLGQEGRGREWEGEGRGRGTGGGGRPEGIAVIQMLS